MTRVVVTGASGFIGRETIAPLLARGFEVHVLGRTPVDGATLHACDLLAEDAAPRLAAIAPSHLLHLAWYAVPGRFWNAPENLDWVAASLRLVRGFAAAGGTRVVVAGTGAEYDWSFSPLDERTTPLAPATLYGQAKASLHAVLAAAAPGLGLSLGWGRVFFPYGPFEHAGRLLPDVIDAVAAGRRVATTDGLQTRDFAHVEDVATALVALLASPVEGPVNIASGTATSVRTLVELAARRAGDPGLIDWGARPRQPGEPPVLEVAVDRLRHEVGFQPRWSLVDGIADAVHRRGLLSRNASPTRPARDA